MGFWGSASDSDCDAASGADGVVVGVVVAASGAVDGAAASGAAGVVVGGVVAASGAADGAAASGSSA